MGTNRSESTLLFDKYQYDRVYHLSDASLLSKLGKPLWSTTTCMYKHTICLSTTKCWFCSLVPIVKCAHCRHYNLAFVCCEQCIVGNGHILQWDLINWAKSTFCGVETKSMFIHIRSSAPNMFAKFGWKSWMFCPIKMEKVVAKLESDRL